VIGAELQRRLETLAGEYVTLVEAMRQGQYADDEEWQRLSADRTLVHDELLAPRGVTRGDDMYAHCRELLRRSRGRGLDSAGGEQRRRDR
jgi:hypothetical protein